MDTALKMFTRMFRRYRIATGTMTECARIVGYDHSYISQIENGKKVPPLKTARDFDQAFDAHGVIIDQAQLLREAKHEAASNIDTEDNTGAVDEREMGDMERRQLLQALGFTGAAGAAGAAGAFVHLDAVRATLEDALDRSVEEWQEVAWEYGRDVLTMPAADLLGDLSADVLAVRRLLTRSMPGGQRASLQHVAAQLSALVALTLGDLGEISRARSWWRTAVTAADRAGDADLRVHVRAKRAINDLYLGVPANHIAAATDHTLALPGGGAGRLSALGARAQALALAGDPGASSAVDELADAHAALTDDADRSQLSFWGWSEKRLHFTRSYVYIRTADPRASDAQDAALTLYPSAEYENPALIELHRATWLARNGDPSEGLRHGTRVVTSLPRRHRSYTVMVTAREVQRALPAGAEITPEAAGYRELLAAATPE